ncbi:DegT/DnrJ/EryC1/StrS family aminotransferase [Chloroflexota bacterium]
MSELRASRLLSDFIQREYVAWTGRGSSAMYALLKTMDYRERQIVVPNNICWSVIATVILSGNEPYFVDIDNRSQSISPEELEKIALPHGTIIIYPHMYGICHRIEEISLICNRKGWFLLEDCAPSLGSRTNGTPAGCFGEASIFSFGLGKIIDCGGGGAIAVNDRSLHESISKTLSTLPGRPDEFELQNRLYSALFKHLYQLPIEKVDLSPMYLALVQTFRSTFVFHMEDPGLVDISLALEKLDENIRQRLANAAKFEKLFSEAGIPVMPYPDGSVYWRLNIFFPETERNTLLAVLHANNLNASSWYPPADLCYKPRASTELDRYPNSDRVGRQILNFWVNDEIDEQYINTVSRIVIEHFVKSTASSKNRQT